MKLQHEIRHALAGLQNTPMFVFTLVFTLALTLGALIAAFNLNQLILFKPLPYKQAAQLYILDQTEVRQGKVVKSGVQHIDSQVQMYRSSQDFLHSALVLRSRGILASVPSEPRLQTLYTTAEFFDLLTVPLALGTGLSASPEMKDARPEAVLSYATWQSYFAADPDIIGQSIQFDHQQFKVVGVLDKGFKEPQPFAETASDIYLPAAYSQLSQPNGTSSTSNLLSLVKLTPGQNPTQINAQLSAIFKDFLQSPQAQLYRDVELLPRLTRLSDAVKGDSARITLMILVGALVLLLIAFVNVLNLYLSHINKKQQILAICACLGAKPKALFKRLFVESLLLTLVASLFALIIAAWLLVLTKELAQGTLPRLNELGLDVPTVLFSCAIAVLLAGALAFFGRFAVNYDGLKQQLNASGKGTSAQVSRRVRYSLIASQIALTGLLIMMTSLVLQMSLQTANHPLGIDIENVISVEVDPGKNYPSATQIRTLATQIKQHFAQLPQVELVANSRHSPLRFGHSGTLIYDSHQQRVGGFLYNRVDEDFVGLVKLPMLHGRNFNREEVADQAKVALLSQSMARAIFNRTDVVGERIYRAKGQAFKVVGVVEDYFSVSNIDPYFYMPLDASDINLMLKIKPGMSLTKLEILQQLRTIDPSLRIQEYLQLQRTAAELVYQYSLAAWLAGGLSLFALLLACTGIYGVISYATQMRRYELGVRMALGAKRKRIVNMVLKDAIQPIVIGLVSSFLLAVLLYGMAKSQIAQLGQPDVLQISAALGLLLLFSILACFIPANSIVRQDPIKALRNE